MRVAIVTESFLPQVDGVTNSVLRVCEQLADRSGETLVVASGPGPDHDAGARVVRAPSVPLPGCQDVRLARPWPELPQLLRDSAPDVVHLASPAVLGAQAAFTARALGLPVVAVQQTDLVAPAVAMVDGRFEAIVRDFEQASVRSSIHVLARRRLRPESVEAQG